MAPLVISMVPMLQSMSKKRGNVSRNRRSGSIKCCVTSSSVSTSVLNNELLVFVLVLIQEMLVCRHTPRPKGKPRRKRWLSRHPKGKIKRGLKSLLQLTKPRELHSKLSQQQTLVIAHLMSHPLMTTHHLQILIRTSHLYVGHYLIDSASMCVLFNVLSSNWFTVFTLSHGDIPNLRCVCCLGQHLNMDKTLQSAVTWL